jgi:hypothetical protein
VQQGLLPVHPDDEAPTTGRDAWWSLGDRPDSHVEDAWDDTAAWDPEPWDDAPVARTRDGRPARAPRPAALPPGRALAGAAVAVAGVLLGIGTLLWATDAPSGDPALRPPTTAATAAGEQPADLAGTEPAVPDPGVGDGAVVEPSPVPDAAAPPAAEPPAAPSLVPVLVLNNSRIDGLAARAAEDFERAGWPVRDTGDFRGRIRATTIYYEPGQEGSAREFADRFPAIERVLPRFDGLPGSGLTVVVTRDYVS